MSTVQIVTLLLSFTLLPVIAAAQQADTFEDMSRAVETNQRVAIKDVGGATTRGEVLRVTASAITLQVGLGRTRTFERATVSEVRRSDRLWNGLLIGAGAGVLATEIWSHQLCGPRGYDPECSAIVIGVGWLTFVPGATVVGALIDKAIGNQLIYSRRPGGAAIHLRPTISPSQVGFAAGVTF